MVDVNELYKIDVDSNGNFVAKYRRTGDFPGKKKPGELGKGWGLIGFYSSFDNALKAVINYEFQNRLSKDRYTLQAAAAELEKVRKDIALLLNPLKTDESDGGKL